MEISRKSLAEQITVLVLAGGLVMVAYQINQATSIAEAEIRAEGTSRWRAVDGTRQSEIFAVVLAKSYEDPTALSLAEMIELDAYYMGVVDQASSAFEMNKAGFRDTDTSIKSYLTQAAHTYFGNAFAQAWWLQYRELLVGDDDEFSQEFDEEVSAVSESRNRDMYSKIRKELASLEVN